MEFKQPKFAKNLKHIAGQKFTWLALSMVCLTYTAYTTRPEENPKATDAAQVSLTELEKNKLVAAVPEAIFTSSAPFAIFTAESKEANDQKPGNKLVAYAKSLLGRPYTWGGTTKSGFDCSGFVYHIFKKFDFDVERSSRAQSAQGTEVVVEESRPGDLLFFTGTNPKIRKVGHVGIVISKAGEPVRFVHASSNGGVKISELEGYYNTRFMFAKRM